MTPDDPGWQKVRKRSIIEIREENNEKPAMRGPFLLHTPSSWLLTENSRIRLLSKLSELGWFDEGFGHFLSDLTDWKPTGPARDP